MMKKFLIPALLIASLSGCSSYNAKYQVPVPQDHAKAYQLKLQASRHWDIIAEDIAKQSFSALSNKGLNNSPVSIKVTSSESSFSKALDQFVVTRLVNEGVVVKKIPDNKIVMEHEIQVVRFNAKRNNRLDTNYTPGEYTGTAVGLVVLYNAVTKWSGDSIRIGGIALGAIRDAVEMDERFDDSNLKIPNVEVIVHSSLVKDGNYIMRRSDVYYVNEPDATLYKGIEKMPSRTLKVVDRCGDKECSK